MNDKRLDDFIDQVQRHEKRINGLDVKAAEDRLLLKSVKGDTTAIKKKLEDLPCSEHHDELLVMKTKMATKLSFRRRAVGMILGSGGVTGVILLTLRLTGVI